ncbi:MAG: cytochrome c biogenesis protein CcsA [Desulfovibrionales bacterium]|nr:cytochrome c biogenesis protein CcsA [Desulfovibrionales bacterium]
MTASRLFELLIALLYLAGSITYPLGLGLRLAPVKRLATWTTGIAFALHSIDLVLRLTESGADALQHGQFYMSLLGWFFIFVFLLLWWRLRHDFLAMISSPLALVLFSSSLAIRTQVLAVPEQFSALWFSLHVGTIFVSLALIAMAFGAGMAYIYLERKIKTKTKLPGFSKDLPSLDTFDRANHWAVSIGFPLYSISLLAGFLWASFTWKKVISWDPKELISLAIWLLFAALYHQRLSLGWRGRKPAKTAVLLFALCMVSLLGVNFLLPTHHSFRP